MYNIRVLSNNAASEEYARVCQSMPECHFGQDLMWRPRVRYLQPLAELRNDIFLQKNPKHFQKYERAIKNITSINTLPALYLLPTHGTR